MKIEEAIRIVSDFKGNSLKLQLKNLKHELIGSTKYKVSAQKEVYEAALVVKKISAQINEIVHATGIINCLPKILLENEIVEDLSLAAGADGDGIDLVTNLRIAEFKFSQWQGDTANGARKRQVFADCVNLFLHENKVPKKKELYVVGAEAIKKFFSSEKASWEKVLSKSGGLDRKLNDYLFENGLTAKSIKDIFELSKVEVFEIEEFIL